MSGITDWSRCRRLALMGGTFDPIHLGHLAAAEEVRERYEVERTIFIPSGRPPHKKDYDVSPAEDRYVMTVLATSSNPDFEVSRLEIERTGPSYTIDTVRAMRARLQRPDAEILFITGADAVLEILTWRNAEAVLAESRLLAVHRPGYDLSSLEATLGPQMAARVEPVQTRAMEVSSTEIRQRVASGRSIRYLTPDAVVTYIMRKGLYKQAKDRACPHDTDGGGR